MEDTGRFELDEVDHWPRVTETMDEIVAFIADLIERGFAYEVDGDVYFRVSRWPEYGRLSGQKPDQVEEQEPNPRKEDPRDFALWKATKVDEDTSWPSPWGEGRPGWHIECSAMAEKLLGPVFEIHGGGLDLVFPHHENELAQSRARRHEFAKIWMHNGMLRFTGEKMSKSVGNIETIAEVLDRWGGTRRCFSSSLPTGGARSTSPTSGWRTHRPGPTGSARCSGILAARPAWRVGATRGGTRRRLLHACRPRTHARVARPRGAPPRARRLRARRPRRAGAGPAQLHELARGLQAARAAGTSPAPTSCGGDRGSGVGGAGRPGRLPTRSPAVTREQVYGRRPVREALRGPREVLELWATERAVAAEPWLQDGVRVQIKPDRELGEAAGTRDHQGVLAWVEPYRYADAHELAAGEKPLLACLDQVTDPRNLGAVIRSAEGAGATGVVVPAHGAAMVTPAVARASAGAVEHLPFAVVPNLARYLNEIKRGDLWIYAAAADAEQDLWHADLTGGLARLRRRGKGRPPARATSLRHDGLDPPCGPRRVAERQRRRGPAPLRGAATAPWLIRPSTSSTATTCSTPAAADQRELTDTSPPSSPCAARADSSSGTGRRRQRGRPALGPVRGAR